MIHLPFASISVLEISQKRIIVHLPCRGEESFPRLNFFAKKFAWAPAQPFFGLLPKKHVSAVQVLTKVKQFTFFFGTN
jgi:hypothetical protein